MAIHNTVFATASAAIIAAMLTMPQSARAGERTESCVFSGGLMNCVKQWSREHHRRTFPHIIKAPAADLADAGDAARSDQHYRRWLRRCRPVLKTDQYGVGHYHYAARGCEFGRVD